MLKNIYIYNNYNATTRRFTGEAKEPIVISSSSPGADYSIIDSLETMKEIFKFMTIDNLHKQDFINKHMMTNDWSTLTDAEKDFVILMSASSENDGNKVVHLITTGQSPGQAEAVEVLKNNWVDNYALNRKACSSRINSKALNTVIAKYLAIEDAEDLQHTTRGLAIDYEMKGVRGVVHNGDTYGLLDYFNSTPGTPYEFQGVKDTKAYPMQNGDPDMTNFIADLLNVLLYGNY